MKKKFTILISFILIIFITLSISVYAKEEIINSFPYDEILLNETNTYNGDIKTINRKIYYNGTKELTYQVPKYNMSSKNNNLVSEQAPKVTFITHGLSGSSDSWRFQDIFDGGIIDQLNQITSCDFYIGYVDDDGVVKFDDLKVSSNNASIINFKLTTIENSPRHTVIVFSTSMSKDVNDKVYYDFNYVASVVIKQLKDYDPEHKLPRVNLIGHSRGGLTNLQFALDHPDLVDSMYSLGTPYLGTTMANIHRYLAQIEWIESKFNFPIGEADIIYEQTYTDYYNRWNDQYDELYKDINVIALASYCDLEFLVYALVNFFVVGTENVLSKEEYEKLISNIFKVVGIAIGIYITLPELVQVSLGLFLFNKIKPYLEEVRSIDYEEKENDIKHLFELLFDELDYSLVNKDFEIYDDLCVDLDSQLGIDKGTNKKYKVFNSYIKKYDYNDVVDLTRTVSPSAPAVPHNLEPLDAELLGVIVNNMKTNTPKHCDYIVSGNESGLSIVRYIGNEESSTLSIPSTINNKPVTMICSNAFSNLMNTNENVTEIFIPSSFKTIEERGFKNNTNIEKITFDGNSELTNIEDEAFANIPKLTSISLPQNLSYLGNGVFRGNKLTSITGNNNYTWKDNLLISNGVIYYGNNTNVKVPNDITMIADYAFANSDLTSIELNNVNNVGLYAFYNSNLGTISNYDKLDTISSSALVGTPWFKDNVKQENSTLILGNVLLYMYTDADFIVIPSGITRIIANSIVGSNIKTAVIPDSVKYINGGAFNETPKLNSLILEGTVPPNITDTSVKSNVTLYVKEGYLNTYLNDKIYKVLPNTITTKQINITFKDINGNVIGTKEEFYYSTFDNYILPNIPIGKELLHYVDEHGNIYEINNIINSYNDLTLTPVLKDSIYRINFGSSVLDIKYGEEVDFGVPIKNGYTFIGWYASDGTQITDSSGRCIWNRTNATENLEAKYEIITYNLNLESDRGTFLGKETYNFTVEDPLEYNDLSDIREFGYYFLGWYLDEHIFETTYNYYEDLTLKAKWDGTKINVSSSTLSYVIMDKVAIIDISPLNLHSYYTFTIKSNVTHVTFIGDSYSYKIKIIIESADTNEGDSAIVLSLRNIDIYTPQGSFDNVINANKKSLIINYSGKNYITGASGYDGIDGQGYLDQAADNMTGNNAYNGIVGLDGIVAVKAYKVHLYNDDSSSSITITGGAGGDGGSGGQGQAGGNGSNPPSGSMFNPVKGDNGKKGGDGGNGGSGGNGAFAISAEQITVEDFNTCNLIGGAGGSGGDAGHGGRGGKGANDESANPFTGVGDPGDGGNGGNGGDGGNGGNGSAATNDIDVKGTGGIGGSYGSYGSGGAGGAGGQAGTYGDSGKDGTSGSSGYNGVSGRTGTRGTSSIGSSGGHATHGNLFNNKFYINCVL